MDTDLVPLPTHTTSGWAEFFIYLGAIMVVALAIFYWAFAIRKRKNRIRKYRRHHHHRPGVREQFKKAMEEIRQQQGRHREHRRLNPTLAETGGLPPRREPDQPPPPPPPLP